MREILAQRKRITIVAAFIFIVGFSVIPAQSSSALSLRDILQGLTSELRGRNERPAPEQNPQREQRQPQQPAPTPAPVEQPTAPVIPQPQIQQPVQQPPTQQPQQPVQQVTPTAPVAVTPAVVEPVPTDTSEQVLAVANVQTVIPSRDTAQYQTRQLDPALSQQLLYAGLAVAAVGAILYTLSFIQKRSTARHIPVKFYS